jgi:hypothetical protein
MIYCDKKRTERAIKEHPSTPYKLNKNLTKLTPFSQPSTHKTPQYQQGFRIIASYVFKYQESAIIAYGNENL